MLFWQQSLFTRLLKHEEKYHSDDDLIRLAFQDDDRIANSHSSRLQNLRGDAAMSPHRIIASWSQNGLHSGTRVTKAGSLEYDIAYSKSAPLQRQQINAAYQHISS